MYFNLAIQRVYRRIFFMKLLTTTLGSGLFPGEETVCVQYIGQSLRLHHQW